MATCTARIEAGSANEVRSVGTGFFYGFEDAGSQTSGARVGIPMILTNKHVLNGCDWARIVLTVRPVNGPIDTYGRPVAATNQQFQLDLGALRFDHPDPNVDLCGIFVATIVQQLAAANLEPYHFWMNSAFRLSSAQTSYMRAVEPIAMVGYPSGLWDQVNNAPIVRRGCTATHPLVRYGGQPVFMIDAACFPGSSGSPVFLYEDGMYRSGASSYTPGTQVVLLGVLFAGPQHTATGSLVTQVIPHSVNVNPVTSIPMNLGFVIAASEIDRLGEAVFAKLRPT